MSRVGLYAKMFAAGAVMCIGGPALIIYVTPTEEELFKRYNPDLQKRSLQNRAGKQQDFNNFVGKLKEYSKSNKTIWRAAAEDEAATRAAFAADQERMAAEALAQKEEIRAQAMGIKR